MADTHDAEHGSLIQTPKQLIIVVVLAFAVPITLIAMVAQLVTGTDHSGNNPGMTPEAIANRIKPVGTVAVDSSQPAPKSAPVAPAQVATAPAPGTAPAAAAQADSGKGKSVFDSACTACHSTGAAGAPKFGDRSAWAPRLKSGMDALYTSSLKGKNAMPPKGGNLSLPDGDVRAAVDYMVGAVK